MRKATDVRVAAGAPLPLPLEEQKLCEAIAAFDRAAADLTAEQAGCPEEFKPPAAKRLAKLTSEVLRAIFTLRQQPAPACDEGLEAIRNLTRKRLGLKPVRQERAQEAARLREKMVDHLGTTKRLRQPNSPEQREDALRQLAEVFLADVFPRTRLPLGTSGPIEITLRASEPIKGLLHSYGRYLREPGHPDYLAPDQENHAYVKIIESVTSALADALSSSAGRELDVTKKAELLVTAGLRALSYPADPFEPEKKARYRSEQQKKAREQRIAESEGRQPDNK